MTYAKMYKSRDRQGSRTVKRADAAATLQKYARQKAAAKARKITPATTRHLNTRAVLSNARAIKSLQFNQWGRIQSQTSYTELQHVTSASPLLFHVTNPLHDMHGPYLWHLSLGVPLATGRNFKLWQNQHSHALDQLDKTIYPNGPLLKMLRATFEFKFSGYLDDTRIRVDFIRQKKMDTDFYNQNLSQQFLPSTLNGFTDLAGFNPNQIDRTKFQVLATRRLYINSKGSANLADIAQDRTTTEATTAPAKYCKISLKLDKILKQLRTTVSEQGGDEPDYPPTDTSVHATLHPHKSNWSFDNQHPLSNIWCLISTDDATDIASAVTGDAVGVQIIRKLTWQDRL